MFECKYKFELQDSIACAKYVYKSQRRKKDKIIAFLIPILIVFMVAMLVFDILHKRSIPRPIMHKEAFHTPYTLSPAPDPA